MFPYFSLLSFEFFVQRYSLCQLLEIALKISKCDFFLTNQRSERFVLNIILINEKHKRRPWPPPAAEMYLAAA